MYKKHKDMNKEIKSALIIPAIIWVFFLINFILPGFDLRVFGIQPRTIHGLIGIIASPFLHGGWGHIISNTIPMLILLPVLFIFYGNIKYKVIIFSTLLGGFLVWLMGKTGSNHIGASGMIFSLMGFLIAAGIFKFSLKTILIAVGVIIIYGGAMLQGFIPKEGVSWTGHFFGAVAGMFFAWVYKEKIRTEKTLK